MTASRRQFLLGISAASAVAAAAGERAFSTTLYPPADLSAFDAPIAPRAAELHVGCAAITWGGDDARAIDEIAAVGYRGVQLRSSAVETWGGNPGTLRAVLASRKLDFVALSSGYAGKPTVAEAEDVALHARNARFVREAGGRYLQVIDAARPEGRAPTPEECRALGRRLTEIGKRVADLGVPLGYHHHMGSLGQGPDEVARVMDAVDRRYVRLILDIAHWTQGGGEAARAVRTYHEAILFLHVKDVESRPDGSYRFVELGRGRVDIPAVFAALDEVKFRGWAIVELDAVPDSAGSPKASAEANRRFIEERLKVKV